MRCSWVNLKDEDYIRYHDDEWGKPVHKDCALFEMLILESFQAGLSWQCVLHKRKNFRKAFDNFEVEKVACYGDKKQTELLKNDGLIRHKLKIKAAIQNAKVFLEVQKEFGSFDTYIWGWTKGKVLRDVLGQTHSNLSNKISKDLKKRGMLFVGTTIIYAYLCAIGIVNAHEKNCDLFKK